MKKIPTLFVRDPATSRRYVTDEVAPGCEWVTAGEGVATRKYDGTAVLVRDGLMFKRYTYRPTKGPAPDGFEAATDLDPVTGKQEGWLPVGDGPDDRWHREAWAERVRVCGGAPDGTYELCGPKIQGNPEGFAMHELIRHGDLKMPYAPRTFKELRDFLADFEHEGIVWHHPDGRMAKLKRKDFPR